MDGNNKDQDFGFDNDNAGDGENKISLGDVCNGGGESNAHGRAENVGGVDTYGGDDANCGDGDNKFVCGNDLDDGHGDDKVDGNVDDRGDIYFNLDNDANCVMVRAKLIAMKIEMVMIVVVMLMVVPSDTKNFPLQVSTRSPLDKESLRRKSFHIIPYCS